MSQHQLMSEAYSRLSLSQSQAAGKVHLWLGIAFPTWQGLEYGSYGSFAAAEPEEGHAMMTDSAQAIQQAALSQGFKPQQQPSGA